MRSIAGMEVGDSEWTALGNKVLAVLCRRSEGWSVYIDAVAGKIRQHVLMGSPDRLVKAVERALKRREQETPAVDKAAIVAALAALDTKIATATDRLVTVDLSLVEDVEAKLIDLKRQRSDAAAELETMSQETPPADAEAIAAKIWQLDVILRDGRPAATRAALSKIIDRRV